MKMITVVLRETPSGNWHASSITNEMGGMGFAERDNPLQAISDCLQMAGVVSIKRGTFASQFDAQQRLERALDTASAARRAGR